MNVKDIICMIAGAIGGAVAAAFGGWTFALTALCILMGLDYITGLVVAGVFHRSPKSIGGGLESHAGIKGLVRKIAVLCVVVISHLIDRLIGTEYLRDATAIAFSLNEIISIMENVGLMGLKLPAVLVSALDVLRQKAGEENSDNTSSASVPSAPSPQGEGLRTGETDAAADGGQVARATEEETEEDL